MGKRHLRLGHSPDADDAFMFYALSTRRVDTGAFEFEHVLADIQTLNEWALSGELEVTAISVAAYPLVTSRYALLSSGASMGGADLAAYVPDDSLDPPAAAHAARHTPPAAPPDRAQGPLLLARPAVTIDQLKHAVIAVPGTMTSAFLALQLALGPVAYTVMPFDAILPAVASGRAAAGLVIHEAQLTYPDHGLHSLLDLGRWWFQRTGLPLPLGCNVVRRDLGRDALPCIARILRAGIEYALAHRADALRHALPFARGLDQTRADAFVSLYVNEWTISLGPLGRRAVTEFLRAGAHAGLLPPCPVEFV